MTNKMDDTLESSMARRQLLRTVAAGALISVLGGTYVVLADDDPRTKEKRSDGKPRLPPGQRLISALKPMGGDPGDPSPGAFKLEVHGEVENPVTLDFAALLALPQTDLVTDVHCVTGWSAFDVAWRGVQISEIAKLAKVKKSARHLIFEAANGYTANVRLSEGLGPKGLIAHKLAGKPIPRPNGPPCRGLCPDLYFWKSPKWLTGLKFTVADEPGFWETRGYNNHADPWLEERYG